MKIVNNYEVRNLSEIPQQLVIKFSHCIRVGDKLFKNSQPAQCRDFLGDAIWAEKYGFTTNIYGMPVDGKKQTLSDVATEFLLAFPDKGVVTTFIEGINFLHDIEDKNQLNHTVIEKLNDLEVYVCGDIFWQKSIFNMSFYTYLLKLCAMKPQNNLFARLEQGATNEGNYYIRVKDKWEFTTTHLQDILKNTKGVSGWDTEGSGISMIGTMHNSSGFVSLITQRNDWNNSICKYFKEAA